MQSRKTKKNSQSRVLAALVGGVASTAVNLIQSAQAEAVPYSSRHDDTPPIHFADPTNTVGYRLQILNSGFTEPAAQLTEGVCGALTNITSSPLEFDDIGSYRGFAILQRGVGQVGQDVFEACLNHVFGQDADQYQEKLDDAAKQGGIIVGATIGGVLTFFATLALMAFLIVMLSRLYFRNRAQHHLPAAVPLLGDIDRLDADESNVAGPSGADSEPSEPARQEKTFQERWGDICAAAEAQGKAIELPKDMECSIGGGIMNDPVISKHGHTYDRQNILNWLLVRAICPQSTYPCTANELVTNYNLKGAMEDFLTRKERKLGLSKFHENTAIRLDEVDPAVDQDAPLSNNMLAAGDLEAPAPDEAVELEAEGWESPGLGRRN